MPTISQKPLSVITISTTLPRQCGIATFNDDLTQELTELGVSVKNIAMERKAEHFPYARTTIGTIAEDNPKQYRAAARLINTTKPSLALIEHEFGIFGGPYGGHVLDLLDVLTVPAVVIVHTYPFTQDEADQLARAQTLREIARRASLLITISDIARARLVKDLRRHDIATPVVHIPHGTPDVKNFLIKNAKAKIGQRGRFILSTFGLISERKGIGDVIEILPAVVAQFPHVLYRVLGRPHPADKKAQQYFSNLLERVEDLELMQHVQFVPRFLSVAEIMHELQATDVYLTYYHDPDQSSSGTLSYAVAAGCCVVSTPYVHARELLDEGRGVLTPFNNQPTLTKTLNDLIGDEEQRQRIQASALTYGETTTWPKVAQQYVKVLTGAAAGGKKHRDQKVKVSKIARQ